MMDEWTIVLIIILGFVILAQGFIILKLTALMKSQVKLNESMQSISDQMTDVEEKSVETQNDVRKLTQYFVNFARGKGSSDKNWYNQV